MSCEQQYASASFGGLTVILKAIIDHQLVYILRCDFREPGELAQQPAQVVKNAFEYQGALVFIKLRHSHREVPVARTAQPAVQIVSDARDPPSDKERSPARHKSEQLQQQPCRNKLKPVAEFTSSLNGHEVKLARDSV